MFKFLNKKRGLLFKECKVETFRSGGPGGTKSDTSESAVRISHEPSGVSAKSSEHRSQEANKKTALRRLREQYATSVRHDVDPDRVKIPEQLAQYLDGGISINPKNWHFPFWVKLILDLMEAYDGRISSVSDKVGISTNQIVKFLKRRNQVWEKANDIRINNDLNKLKA